MIQQPLAVLAVLLGAIVFSLAMVRRFAWAQRLSTILWIIFTAALLSNLGLIPKDAPLYGTVIDFTVPFAVCVILFTVSLRDLLDAGRAMLVAFGLAALGTVVGVVVASLALEPLLSRILLERSWAIAGPYTGTYIGGSLNFFALWTALEVGNAGLLAAANAVDNLTLFPLYAAWMVIPTWLVGRYAVAKRWQVHPEPEAEEAEEVAATPLRLLDVVVLFFLALTVIAMSGWLHETVVAPFAPDVPTILVVTTLALLLAQVGFVRRLKGAWEIGDLAFYLFFAAVGALIDFYQAVVLSPVLFLYVLIIMAVHFAVLYGVGRWLGMDVAVLTIASVAAKSGPAMIAPVAETKGWRHLVLPGILVAMLGYALGNYVGFAVAHGVRLVLGH